MQDRVCVTGPQQYVRWPEPLSCLRGYAALVLRPHYLSQLTSADFGPVSLAGPLQADHMPAEA